MQEKVISYVVHFNYFGICNKLKLSIMGAEGSKEVSLSPILTRKPTRPVQRSGRNRSSVRHAFGPSGKYTSLTRNMSATSPTTTVPGAAAQASGGRKREHGTSRAYTVEDQALDSIAKEAEARLAARRQARAEARDIRMRELERQQKEAEDAMDKEFEKAKEEKRIPLVKHSVSVSSYASTASPSTSRRESIDSTDQDTMRVTISELEEKYKKAMMANAQMDNEKAALVAEVDILKDTLEEQEEMMYEIQREAREKHRDLEFKKREAAGLHNEVSILREMLEQRDKLIEEHGLILVGENGEGNEKELKDKVGAIVVVSPEAAEMLEMVGEGPLDVRLKKFVEEKKELLEEIRILKIDLENERDKLAVAERRRTAQAPLLNGPEMNVYDIQREASKQVNEMKYKLQNAEQELTNLEAINSRLEGQVKRYKQAAETAEQSEEEMKLDKRKLIRENRSLKDQVEELETEKGHLKKRLEKVRQGRITSTKIAEV
ncbi:leucine-rich repeat flightless-interacting protein 2-like isoform X2 [Anneissia japonica]|uniref:leucine-rich repeat flightless-interacting protein 2-like isoform X2 n=1 Tax=Anneissia japonica TaxID=1529436 RepID=UPI001425B917|nr:leucine-rich repeat flightless-interacting protein 2-like isoform X2 [Anneissia japonica]